MDLNELLLSAIENTPLVLVLVYFLVQQRKDNQVTVEYYRERIAYYNQREARLLEVIVRLSLGKQITLTGEEKQPDQPDYDAEREV